MRSFIVGSPGRYNLADMPRRGRRSLDGDCPLSVLLVDDDRAFTEMLTLYLTGDSRIAVTGVAGTLRQALGMAKRQHPEVVVLDVHLPDGDAALGTMLLRQLHRPPAILTVSAGATADEVTSAIQAGAVAFLPKERCIPEIRTAVVSASRAASRLTRRLERAR